MLAQRVTAAGRRAIAKFFLPDGEHLPPGDARAAKSVGTPTHPALFGEGRWHSGCFRLLGRPIRACDLPTDATRQNHGVFIAVSYQRS